MKILKKYREEVINQAGLTFKFNFNPISKRLTVTCSNPPSLSYIHSVEEVMKPWKFEEIDDVLTGIIYKCPSYERFLEIIESVRKS